LIFPLIPLSLDAANSEEVDPSTFLYFTSFCAGPRFSCLTFSFFESPVLQTYTDFLDTDIRLSKRLGFFDHFRGPLFVASFIYVLEVPSHFSLSSDVAHLRCPLRSFPAPSRHCHRRQYSPPLLLISSLRISLLILAVHPKILIFSQGYNFFPLNYALSAPSPGGKRRTETPFLSPTLFPVCPDHLRSDLLFLKSLTPPSLSRADPLPSAFVSSLYSSPCFFLAQLSIREAISTLLP